MTKVLDEHLAGVREQARSSTAKALRAEVKAQRQREKMLRKRGLAGAFDDLTWGDLEKLKKDGTYAALADVEEFQARVRFLEGERAGWLEAIELAEDSAVAEAMENLPVKVKLSMEHDRQRSLFFAQHGVDDIDRAPAVVKGLYRELVERQAYEIRTSEN